MDARMKTLGFTQLSVEHCIYYRRRDSGVVFAAVHIDDFTVAASSIEEERRFEEELGAEWKISRDDAHFIVGWAIRRDRQKHTVYLSQKALIDPKAVGQPSGLGQAEKGNSHAKNCITSHHSPSQRLCRAASRVSALSMANSSVFTRWADPMTPATRKEPLYSFDTPTSPIPHVLSLRPTSTKK
jgi:hypothetical protein